MFDIKNGMIYITKGDSATIEVELKNNDNTDYELQSGDTLKLTVRRRPSDSIIIQITSTSNVIELKPINTKNLVVGQCCYDIELEKANGDIYTVVGLTDNILTNMVVYPEITE